MHALENSEMVDSLATPLVWKRLVPEMHRWPGFEGMRSEGIE
jgi:hypothetical protein